MNFSSVINDSFQPYYPILLLFLCYHFKHILGKSPHKEEVKHMHKLYSAKLLFESSSSPKVRPDKIFEERIILVRAKTIEK